MKKCIFETLFWDKNFHPDTSKNSTQKVRNDIQIIAQKMAYSSIRRHVISRRGITTLFDIGLLQKIACVKRESMVLIQYPDLCNAHLSHHIIKQLIMKCCKIVVLIHDLIGVRFENRQQFLDEKAVLEKADVIIVHNAKMAECLRNLYELRTRIVELEIFDYLIATNAYSCPTNSSIIVAGNLTQAKAGYLNALCDKNPACSFALYGNGYSLPPKDHVHYYGVFPSDELPTRLDGRWGLIWDGQTTSTCSGNYGEYLKINNPHKTSLYIAAGIPVIVWSQSAMADYVRNRGVGIVVDDIEHLAEDTRLTDEAYGVLLENVKRESERLRTGYYTRRALQQAEQFLLENK